MAHPIAIKQVKDFWPITRIMPGFLINTFLKNAPPFKVSQIKQVRSNLGKEIQGYFITLPLLTEQMRELKEEFILDKIIAAGHIAERLGVRILGLGGYLSILAEKGFNVYKNLKIPVTSGSTFTAWSVIEAVYRMSKAKNIDLGKSTLAVIGATGSIGSLCARKLSDYIPKIIISDSPIDKLEKLKEAILHINPVEVIVEDDTHKAVKDADIIIYATNLAQVVINIEELKPHTIVCDVSVSKNIAGKINLRRDISIIDGSLIKLPFPTDFGINTGLAKDMVDASMAETILLTFEERFVNYSLGDNINLDKLDEIADIAVKYGFEVWVPGAPLL